MKSSKMSSASKNILQYFKKNDSNSSDGLVPPKLLHADTQNVTSAELSFTEAELKSNSTTRRDKYTKNVPSKTKEEVVRYALEHGRNKALKKFSKRYPMYHFKRQTINNWKDRLQNTKDFTPKFGRPNLLDDDMLCKVQSIIIGTCVAGTAISRQQVIKIARGVIKANNLLLIGIIWRGLRTN